MRPKRLSDRALRVCCGAGKILASFLRFWAVAARRKSSFAPHGPRNRSRPSPRMRLRCANSISTFFRSFIEISYWRVLAISRATWRASSCSPFVRICFDQAGINRHALSADETFLNAPGDGRLEQMTQQFALPETAMAVLREGGVVRNPVVQIKAAEPPIREVQVHLFAEPSL